MKTDESTHFQNSRRARRVAERSFWQSIEIRAVGVGLLFMSVMTYVQGSHAQDIPRENQRRIEALSQALMSEQENVKKNGDTPVAPAPSAIVKNPDVVTIKGEKGDKGDPGASGVPGKNGTNGSNGQSATLPPLDELKGEKGDKGDPGEPGVAGKDGQDGKDGTNGKDGSPPSDITITIDGTTYVCTPVADGSTSFKCDAQESESPTPSPGSSDEIGAQP